MSASVSSCTTASDGWAGYLYYTSIGKVAQILETGYSHLRSLKDYVFGSCDPVEDAEDKFLRCLKNKYYRYYIDVGDNCRIWTLSSIPFPSDGFDSERPYVVLIHGLLSGIAFWSMNFDEIYQSGYDLFAIDLPGFGRSTRTEFTDDDQETERIFVDMIERWRQKIGLKHMLMVGHSFGGFVSTIYAFRYPEYVKHLILVDPWGFPDIREEVTTVLEYGTTQISATPLVTLPVWVRVLMIIFMPFSPFTFLRLSGSYLGPKIIHLLRSDLTRRYACVFGDDDVCTVPNYIYHTNKFTPTGEMAFRSLSMPLAWAKNPLIKRISNMDKSVQLTFIYGSRSWIDFQTGYEVKGILTESNVNVHVIDEAGHHLFADQPDTFNALLSQIIQGTIEPSHTASEIDLMMIKDVTL